MGWLHSEVISQHIHGGILYPDAEVNRKDELKEVDSTLRSKFQFGRYIYDSFLFDTSRNKLVKVYDWVYKLFIRKSLSPKLSNCKHPEKDLLFILGVVFNKDSNIEGCTEKMNKLLDATDLLINGLSRNIAGLQHIVVQWGHVIVSAFTAFATMYVNNTGMSGIG